jgi:hypothetical protein
MRWAYLLHRKHGLFISAIAAITSAPSLAALFSTTNLPLTTWFLSAYLIIQAKTRLWELSLRQQLVVSYNTARSIKQKLMKVMKERDDSKPLSGIIQLDDMYWGAQQKGS